MPTMVGGTRMTSPRTSTCMPAATPHEASTACKPQACRESPRSHTHNPRPIPIAFQILVCKHNRQHAPACMQPQRPQVQRVAQRGQRWAVRAQRVNHFRLHQQVLPAERLLCCTALCVPNPPAFIPAKVQPLSRCSCLCTPFWGCTNPFWLHAFQARLCSRLVAVPSLSVLDCKCRWPVWSLVDAAVLRIIGDGVAQVLEVHTNLVRPPCHRPACRCIVIMLCTVHAIYAEPHDCPPHCRNAL